MNDTINASYKSVQTSGGFFQDTQRRLYEITGADRASWLHNLTTNTISTLQSGDGNYAFAVTVQGRTVCDLNCLVLEDRLWIDLDNRWADESIAHLGKYRVVEDVEINDVSASWTRLDVIGPKTADFVERLGMGNNFAAYADLQHSTTNIDGHEVRLVKGSTGFYMAATLYVPAASADAMQSKIQAVASELNMIELEHELQTIIRIESGIPISVDDIDSEVIPPETLQTERGISYVKGCYLGQEVIERMRSRDSMARRLVGLKISGERMPAKDSWVFADTKQVGRITSACHSVALNSVLALGYIKTSLAEDAKALRVALDESEFADAELVDLPLSAWIYAA
ncbi:MAG: glycine cleavage system protein T [Phycisphaerae bacterium]|nr:MAG: glycine cleavage system protein T [Phycisphaerae bacterium]